MSAGNGSIEIRLGLVAALALLAAIAATSLVRMNRFGDAAQWRNHTHETIQALDELMFDIASAEASQRGFMLTGDETYLKPYGASRSQISAYEGHLRSLVSDRVSQLERVDQIEGLIRRRLALLDAGIDARRAAPDRLHFSRQHFAEGQEVMDAIQALAARTRAEESALLAERTSVFERDRFTTRLIIVAGNAVALILLLLSFGVMMREVRNRKDAETRAHRYARQVEDLYNNAPCGYHSLDVDGNVVQINNTELAWLGYDRDEVVGKPFVRLLPEAARAQFSTNFVQFKSTGTAHDLEYELQRRDGSILPVALNATLVRSAQGDYLMSRSTLFDITKRRRAEQALHRANAFLDSVLEHIPSMIFVKDAADLRYVRFNQAGERVLGMQREDVLGKRDHELFNAAEADRFNEVDRQVLQTRQMLESQEAVNAAAGERILHTRKLAIVDETGEPRYLLGIAEDITERRQAELRIIELNSALEMRAQQLEATNQELESFSYSVSHDLRAPLRAIDGFSRMIQEDYASVLNTEGMRLLRVIRDNTRRMAQLIDDLLAFSHLGRQALNEISVDMTALAQSAWMQLHEGAVESRASCKIESLPHAVGDPILLRQVWANLLSNALKYSSKSKQPLIEVSASNREGQVVYCVRDDGVGFDARYSDKLFGVFQRLHSHEEFPGTGVGLAIVKRIVTRHGGRVWAESEVGKGAQFYFTLAEGRPDGADGTG
jgi:PAS domain S-box-containing protein